MDPTTTSCAAGTVAAAPTSSAKTGAAVLTTDIRPNGVAVLTLTRPHKRNAMTLELFQRLIDSFQALDDNGAVRCVVLAAAGSCFCAGMDFAVFMKQFAQMRKVSDDARRRLMLRKFIRFLQSGVSAAELCRKPVIAAVQGPCIGGGVDLITACDIRVCSSDATFSVKEVALGITADLGSLQRLPSIVGSGHAMRLALTGETITAADALRLGLVSQVVEPDELLSTAMKMAEQIASYSPVAVLGTKQVLLHQRDHPHVADGLNHIQIWNSAFLMGEDVQKAIMAAAARKPAVFSRL